MCEGAGAADVHAVEQPGDAGVCAPIGAPCRKTSVSFPSWLPGHSPECAV